MKYAYIRVSTVEQNEDRQVEAMKKHDIPAHNYFVEKISGKNTDRPELQKLLATVKTGDTIYIHDFSRLSRSVSDLLRLVDDLNARGVHLVSNKENLDTSTPTGKLMLTMIGAINEFERTNLLERQREGIACARERGVYGDPVDKKLFETLYTKMLCGKLTKADMARQLGITRPTLYKMIKRHAQAGA